MNTIRIFLAAKSKEYKLIANLLSASKTQEYDIVGSDRYPAAVDAISSTEYDLILFGFAAGQLASLMQSLEQPPRSPILLLTDLDGHPARGTARKAGAAGYIHRDHLDGPLIEQAIQHSIETHRLQTNVKSYEKRYQGLESQYKIIVNNNFAWEFWLAPDGVMLYMSAESQQITGWPPKEFLDNPELLLSMIHTDDRQAYIDRQQSLFATPVKSSPVPFEFRLIDKAGNESWIAQLCQSIYDGEGSLMAFRFNNRDISARKKTEEIIEDSENKFRELAETLENVLWLKTSDNHTYMHPLVEATWGQYLHGFDFAHQSFMDRIHPEDRESLLNAFNAPEYTEHGMLDIEFRLIYPDNEIKCIRASTFPVQNDNVLDIVGIAQDITNLKQEALDLYNKTDQELQHSQMHYQTLVDNFPNGAVILFNHELRYTLAGGSGLKETGLTKKYLEGKTIWEVYSPDVCARTEPAYRAALRGETSVIETNYSGKVYEQRTLPIKNRQDEVVGGMVMSQDITRHRQLETSLKQANSDLSTRISELKQRNQEANLLNRMGELMQSCREIDDAYHVLEQYLPKFFPKQTGAVYIFQEERKHFELLNSWGPGLPGNSIFTSDDCWALRRGQPHIAADTDIGLRCNHLNEKNNHTDSISDDPTPYLCAPLNAQGKTLGLLHIQFPYEESAPIQHWKNLALTVTDWVAPAMANLKFSETLRIQSIRDPLTNLYNRRYMEETLKREIHRANRHHHQLGIMMIDIDHFKQYNDTYGHTSGDVLLQHIGEYFLANVRGEDFACRYGGEEFILVLPEATAEDTNIRGEQLLAGIRNLETTVHGETLPPVTISIGTACFPENGQDMDDLIQAADSALYQAKNEGRDRLVSAKSST